MSLFDSYDTDLEDLRRGVETKLQEAAALEPEARRERLTEASSELDEADRLLKRMEVESHSASSQNERERLLSRLKARKDSVKSLRQQHSDISKGSHSAHSDRQALLGAEPLSDDDAPTSSSQRERMLSANDRLKKTGERIQHGKRQLLETEELGANILSDLHRQRETITNARGNLHSVDETIGRSRRVLSAMSRRASQNKLILALVAVMLVVAIVIVIVVKARGGGNNSSNTT
jgi:vesicle transport through interaction with t-SNAREs protein 1